MAGGAPVPVPTSDPDEKILSIADLEKAASTKLGKTARGKCEIPTLLCSIFVALSWYPVDLSYACDCMRTLGMCS